MQQLLAVQALDIGAAVLPGPPELPLPWLLCYWTAALHMKLAGKPCHRGGSCCEGWPAEATRMSVCLPACSSFKATGSKLSPRPCVTALRCAALRRLHPSILPCSAQMTLKVTGNPVFHTTCSLLYLSVLEAGSHAPLS